MDRNSQIIRTSVIGIIANVLLAAFKAIVGIIANSVAIVMDAVNNLSDALSSVITIVGAKLSQRPADNKSFDRLGRSVFLEIFYYLCRRQCLQGRSEYLQGIAHCKSGARAPVVYSYDSVHNCTNLNK